MVHLSARGFSIYALVLLCATPAAAQPPAPARQIETGREWLDRCGVLGHTNTSGSDARAGDGGTGSDRFVARAGLTPSKESVCVGWVEGLVDLNEIYRGLGALEQTREGFCTPPTATVADAARAVARYLRDHPDALHFSARILAYMALRQAFPCERRTP